MKKLLFGIISILFLASTTAHAVIFARQVWQHPNGKIVELFSDVHAQYFAGNYGEAYLDQRDLLESVDIRTIATKQRCDIINYAKLFGDNAHILVEDRGTHLKETYADDIGPLVEGLSVLNGLIPLSKEHGISSTNIECRDLDLEIDEKTYTKINKYNDGLKLNLYYKALKILNCIMDIHVIHTVYEYTNNKEPKFICNNRLFVIAGFYHVLLLSRALPFMGYKRVETKLRVHAETQKIINNADVVSETIVQNYIKHTLRLKNKSRLLTTENMWWATAFLVTHPLDIAQIIEEERKEMIAIPVAAETKEIAALRSTTPAVATPVIRSRL